MVFRKTTNEYVNWPIGELQPYGEGTYIDVENNVYFYNGTEYIKIGYDKPNLDIWLTMIPKFGLGMVLVNTFAPKRRDGKSSGVGEVLIGIAIAFFVLLWYNIFAWIGYQILTLFVKPLLQATEKVKWLRLFLPFIWFVDNPNKDQVAVAMGATMLLPYGLLSMPVLALANYDAPELKPLAIFLIIYTLISAFYMFINFRINKDNLVHK